MTFKLTIELGNAEMQTGRNVAQALKSIAEKVEDTEDFSEADVYDRTGKIRDDNGNTVGKWAVTGR